MKFFLGLALRESRVTTEKNTGVLCLLFPTSVGKLSLGKPARITFSENKDVKLIDQI